MFKKFGILFFVLIALVLIFATTKPGSFSYSRSIVIEAPAEKIFPFVNTLTEWPKWSPYEKLDPKMNRKLSGPSAGVGAVYEWDGNSNIGAGRMAILDVNAPNSISIQLDFFRPMKGTNQVTFSFEAQGASTKVTWAMSGVTNYLGKLISVFIDCEKMVGDQFSEGLMNLKKVVEEST
jgi:hypothetical protein